uniref:Uncharacterized protein n=1 Tax=Parascaris equorum TaxID=6256 RepID=A0A914RQS4_PAREQ
MALLKMRGTSEESIAEYRRMRKAVQARAESIKIVRPLFSAFEKNHKIVQTWISEEKVNVNLLRKRCVDIDQLLDVAISAAMTSFFPFHRVL